LERAFQDKDKDDVKEVEVELGREGLMYIPTEKPAGS